MAFPIDEERRGIELLICYLQMQKLKMNTETAMLTMDKVPIYLSSLAIYCLVNPIMFSLFCFCQVLESNELTMALTAAIPGVAIMGAISPMPPCIIYMFNICFPVHI
jgi:hypothetical protein